MNDVSENETASDHDGAAYSSDNDEFEHLRPKTASSTTKLTEITPQKESSYEEYYERHSSFSKSVNTTGGSAYSVKSDNRVHQTLRQTWNDLWIIGGILIVLIAILVLIVVFKWPTTAPRIQYNCPQFKELRQHFASQDDVLFKALKIGIEGVLNNDPTKPSVFLLAYNNNDTVNRVMKEVVEATANCMNSTNPIQLNGRTFATKEMIDDYGVIIHQYNDSLAHNGIMYVADLNWVPAKAAQAFHFICDTIEPLVGRAVIFFTVELDQKEQDLPAREVMRLVENKLESQWRDKKVNLDTLKALIGRVTDQVFLLKSEN